MTKCQRKYWEKRLLQQTKRMLAYYGAPRPDATDGSFLMNAFLLGWHAAMRAQKRETR
jgi:hypothetical protein